MRNHRFSRHRYLGTFSVPSIVYIALTLILTVINQVSSSPSSSSSSSSPSLSSSSSSSTTTTTSPRLSSEINCAQKGSFIQRLKVCPAAKHEEISYRIEVATDHEIQTNFTLQDFEVDLFDLKGDKLVLKKGVNIQSKVYRVAILALHAATDGTINPNCMILEIEVNDKNCSYVRHCSTVISILASFCLILLTALAISLIILRRKKPLFLAFRKKKSSPEEDIFQNGSQTSERGSDSFIIPRKSSTATGDLINGNVIPTRPTVFQPPDGLLMPRKSSLKQSRIEVIPVKDDPLKMLDSGIENAAFQESEAATTSPRRNSVIPELDESKEELKVSGSAENRRKSIVTFSDKTEVIRIAKIL